MRPLDGCSNLGLFRVIKGVDLKIFYCIQDPSISESNIVGT